MAIELQTPIVSNSNRTSGRGRAQDASSSETAKPTEVFKSYYGGIWVKIINKTQFNLNYVPGDLKYGVMINGPPDADAWTTKGFGIGGNTLIGMGPRPKGGIQLRLKLDDSHNFDFTLGLSSALIGSYHTSLVNGHDRNAAIKDLRSRGAAIKSDRYEGTIKQQGKTQFTINVTVEPGYEMGLVISQDD